MLQQQSDDLCFNQYLDGTNLSIVQLEHEAVLETLLSSGSDLVRPR